MSNSHDPTTVGAIVDGKYRVESVLGEGTSSVVCRARNVLTGRLVALKFTKQELLSETYLRAFMLREVRAANRLGHPNVLDIQDIAETPDGRLYLVMEYSPGRSLRSELAQGTQSIRVTATVVEQICRALAHAHERGVVHGRLSAEKVLVVRTSDDVATKTFGFFGMSSEPKLLPSNGWRFIRSAVSIAPEQVLGLEVGPSSDMYSVGCILFEMLTGRPVFDETDPELLLKMHCEAEPPSPRLFSRELPISAERIVLQLLQKDPHARLLDARELAGAILQLQDAGGPSISGVEKRNRSPSVEIPGYEITGDILRGGMAECFRGLDLAARDTVFIGLRTLSWARDGEVDRGEGLKRRAA